MEYFLSTQRLGFRRWRNADLPLALDLWGDPQVTALIGGPFSPQAIEARLALEIAQQDEIGMQYWPIFLLSDHSHAGCAGLRPHDQRRLDQKIFELGIHLRPAVWGQGLASEAGHAVIDFAFET